MYDLFTHNFYAIQVCGIQAIHQMEIIQIAQKSKKKWSIQTPSSLFTSTPVSKQCLVERSAVCDFVSITPRSITFLIILLGKWLVWRDMSDTCYLVSILESIPPYSWVNATIMDFSTFFLEIFLTKVSPLVPLPPLSPKYL